jgi:hypothetical protein
MNVGACVLEPRNWTSDIVHDDNPRLKHRTVVTRHVVSHVITKKLQERITIRNCSLLVFEQCRLLGRGVV